MGQGEMFQTVPLDQIKKLTTSKAPRTLTPFPEPFLKALREVRNLKSTHNLTTVQIIYIAGGIDIHMRNVYSFQVRGAVDKALFELWYSVTMKLRRR